MSCVSDQKHQLHFVAISRTSMEGTDESELDINFELSAELRASTTHTTSS